MVLFEVPTGVVADTVGRRTSYLLGTVTLFGSTLLYLLLWQTHAPFVLWAVASVLLGLGFTFFSGATEAWLVDGLHATGYRGSLDDGLREGTGGERDRDDGRLDRRRTAGAGDEPRRSVRRSRGAARGHLRGRVAGDAGHRLHAEAAGLGARRDGRDPAGLAAARAAESAGPLADARRSVHGRGQRVRLLRRAAVSACSCTATPTPMRSRVCPPGSSPVRRSRVARRRRTSPGSSGTGS